jgi:hypothetical protein
VHGARAWTLSEVPEVDWVAKVKRDLPPVEAGRFFLYGSHDADRVPAGRVPLLIEAAMAFGTGAPRTTLGCLLAIDRLAGEGFEAGQRGRCGGRDRRARHGGQAGLAGRARGRGRHRPGGGGNALANLSANGLEGEVAVAEAAGLDAAAFRAAEPFDLLLANILKGPLLALASDLVGACAPGGGSSCRGSCASRPIRWRRPMRPWAPPSCGARRSATGPRWSCPDARPDPAGPGFPQGDAMESPESCATSAMTTHLDPLPPGPPSCRRAPSATA